ncbi:hypothetical protein COU20_01135 [Candidatus Kaiserbacteria bacterium CG10_big_fil_rev_8_21_14_0_10_59_10]|uniref:Peptidase S74 domain-containing protein n=1 Tax=Candidatus Kaiserbacteria bacterium CG10_big_fil_rev_8_21_14_0_10_59_10 TaxID=1974612 RepID=A0A2H0U8E8_9BACT|nr:MAG: hypothetical protein COU20_01135 [Candidatus Kaiserbacteria bacterium CG10_big_fil_rev_8_21_14_0_10_59_10]
MRSVRGVSFVWESGAREGQKDIGVVAQEVERVLPEAVRTDAYGMKSVDYARLIPLLIEAIKEQQKELEALRAEVRALKGQ